MTEEEQDTADAEYIRLLKRQAGNDTSRPWREVLAEIEAEEKPFSPEYATRNRHTR